jgi:hypothetical protein
MLDAMDRLEDKGTENGRRNIGDIMVAIVMIREHLAAKKIVIEDYTLQDFGVNDYMPFMNYLQHRDHATIKRFILFHPTEISGGQWDIAGNGVYHHHDQADPRSKYIHRRNSRNSSLPILQSSCIY